MAIGLCDIERARLSQNQALDDKLLNGQSGSINDHHSHS
jgi:hypothetical protein